MWAPPAGFIRAREHKAPEVLEDGSHSLLQFNHGHGITSLYQTLFVRSKSLDPVHTQGEGIILAHEYWVAGMLGSHVRSFLQL